MKGGEHFRQLLDGLEQLADVLGEHVQRADGDDPGEHLGGAAAQDDGRRHDGGEVDQRAEDAEDHHLAEAGVVE